MHIANVVAYTLDIDAEQLVCRGRFVWSRARTTKLVESGWKQW
jgi:hypothetical protein